MKTKLTNAERRKAYYMKLWGIDENKSHTEQRRLTKQPEPRHKFTQLEFNFDGVKND